MFPLSSDHNEIDELLTRLINILIQTWDDTGFGCIEIESEKVKHDRIAVTLRGSTHYRYVLSHEDLQRWKAGGKA